MGAKEFASLLGGLALFLYGMNMMSQGMEAAAGNKMKQILERLTTNRYLGVLVGAVITAIIQSSSATGGGSDHGCQYRHDDHGTADRT